MRFNRVALAVVLGLGLSHCAVKSYPRPVTTKEKVQTNVAHSADNLAAVLHRNFLAAGPGYDVSRQMVQVKNYEFYADPSFHSAVNFYQAPDRLPEIKQELISETPTYKMWFLSWPSLYRPINPDFALLYESYAEDHAAYAIYLQSKKPNRGALVVSHGWTDGDIRKYVKRNRLEAFVRQGYDAALIQQPYHGLRMPQGEKFSGEYFLSGEISRLNEAMAQAVMDVRSLAAWLRQDHPVVGITGGSLGGFVTLAVAAADPRLDFAVAWVPPSSLGDFPENSRVVPYVIKGMKRSGLDKDTLKRVLWVSSPANYPPALPKENVLIFAGMGDNFVPPDQPQKVWDSWGHPPIFWYAGGHFLNFELKQSRQIEAEFLKKHLEK